MTLTQAFVDLRESTFRSHQLGLFMASGPDHFTMDYAAECRGREQAYIDLILDPDLVKQIMDVGLYNAIEYSHALVKCGVDALYIGDPASSASLILPGQFEEFCLPRLRLFCEELHKSEILIYLHICGNSKPILEMMADTGVDCIEPLDPLGGVKVADAKRRVGQRVALMGGVNTLTLIHKDSQQVYDEAIACCQAGAENGGYILAAGDMVPEFTPEKNVKALVRAAKDFPYDKIS